MFRFLVVFILCFSLFSCLRNNTSRNINADDTVNRMQVDTPQEPDIYHHLSIVLSNAELPESIHAKVRTPAFIQELSAIMQSDPFLWALVDKERPLNENYEPLDLIELRNASYRVNRSGLLLRQAAAESLEEMAAAARGEGLTLLASSAYRSYDYQAQVYQRYVRELGQQAADRISARPGHSQHQLGLVIDFGSIDDSFALTPEGRWLTANASRFGWSLSYPQGYEHVTGYTWESWHYRYTGRELARFIDNYFDGIQQYALRFIYEYRRMEIRGFEPLAY